MELLEKHFEIALETPDGIKKLRELILTLAMQGKLVPQDPMDQPATELLKEIETEKKKLSNKGKTKQIESISIKQEEIPHVLPKSWEWTALYNLGEINPRNTADDGLTTAFVPMSFIFAEYGKEHILEEKKWGEIKKGFTHFAENDVVLAKITPCFENGKSCIMKNLPNKIGAGTTELHVFRDTYGKICQEYVLAYLKSPRFVANGINKMTGSAGQKRVPTEYFAKSPFPLPPLAEQKRIVAKIDQLMALCDKLESERNERDQKRLTIHTAATNHLFSSTDQKQFTTSWSFITRHFDELYSVSDNVADLKKTILQLAVMGKLVPQDPKDQPASELLKEIESEKKKLVKEGKIKKVEELLPIESDEKCYEIPKTWEFVRLADIAWLITDGTHLTPKYTESGRTFLSAQNVKPFLFLPENCRFVSEEHYQGYIKNRKPELNDILITRVGSNIGEAAVIDKPIDFAIYVSLGLIKFFPHLTNPRYLVCWLNSPDGKKKSFENTLGKGVSQSNLNLSLIRKFVVPLPPLPEQKRIVAKVDQLMKYCESLEQHIKESTEKKSAILNAVLAGV